MFTNRRSFLTAAGLGLFGTAMASPRRQNTEGNNIKTEFAFKAEITLDKTLES